MPEIDDGNERTVYSAKLKHLVKRTQLIFLSHSLKTDFYVGGINRFKRFYERIRGKPHSLIARNLCRRARMYDDSFRTEKLCRTNALIYIRDALESLLRNYTGERYKIRCMVGHMNTVILRLGAYP